MSSCREILLMFEQTCYGAGMAQALASRAETNSSRLCVVGSATAHDKIAGCMLYLFFNKTPSHL